VQAFGRPSPAASVEPPLRPGADSASAAYRADGGTTGWCSLRAATIAGVGHRLAGDSNQDCYAWAVAGSRLVVALADGLGSVPGSAAAARAAALTAASSAAGAAEGPRESALAGVEAAEAQLRDGELTAGATTVIVCVVEAGGEVALCRVGDSTAFLIGCEGEPGWREVFPPPPDHEEEVPVATGALAAGAGMVAAAVETVEVKPEGSEVVVVVSDGLAGPWRDGPSTVAPSMVEGILERPSPLQLAGLADFSRQGCHDDRTIVAVWPVGTWRQTCPPVELRADPAR
jgi:serine/threonine protein phosphatase PrpC